MSYSSEVLADSPIAYERLSSSADTSGNGYSLSAAGGAAFGNATGLLTGDSDTCSRFDGSGGVLASAATSALGSGWTALTVEIWLRRNGAQPDFGFGTLANKYRTSGTTQPSYAVFAKDTGCRFRLNTSTSDDNNNFWEISTDLTSGDVHHLVWTWASGGTPICYVDSVAQSLSSSAGSKGGSILADAAELLIGASDTAGTVLRFRGDADEMAVYSSAISSGRVLAHYNAGIGGGSPPTSRLLNLRRAVVMN
jgi:hypothetical protein